MDAYNTESIFAESQQLIVNKCIRLQYDFSNKIGPTSCFTITHSWKSL